MPKNPVLFPIKKIELTLYNGKVKNNGFRQGFYYEVPKKIRYTSWCFKNNQKIYQ